MSPERAQVDKVTTICDYSMSRAPNLRRAIGVGGIILF